MERANVEFSKRDREELGYVFDPFAPVFRHHLRGCSKIVKSTKASIKTDAALNKRDRCFELPLTCYVGNETKYNQTMNILYFFVLVDGQFTILLLLSISRQWISGSCHRKKFFIGISCRPRILGCLYRPSWSSLLPKTRPPRVLLYTKQRLNKINLLIICKCSC